MKFQIKKDFEFEKELLIWIKNENRKQKWFRRQPKFGLLFEYEFNHMHLHASSIFFSFHKIDKCLKNASPVCLEKLNLAHLMRMA